MKHPQKSAGHYSLIQEIVMTEKNKKKPVSVIEADNQNMLAAIPPEGAGQLPVPVNGLTLDAEAAKINSFYDKIEKTTCDLNEHWTTQRVKLGHMLNHHQRRVIELGISWTQYAIETFPKLEKRTREKYMAVAAFGDRVKPYYYMGVDRVYYLFNKLIHYYNDPDFQHIRSRYAYIFDPASKTLLEKEDVKVKADVIRNFFTFKNQVKRNDFDKDLLLDVLEAGCTFGKKDYEYLNQPNVTPNDIVQYLIKMMVTASSPAQQKSSSTSRISIHVILSQLFQTLQGYNAKNIIPEFLSVEFLDSVIDAIITLRHRMAPTNDQEVS
jgi:hypothetical protein